MSVFLNKITLQNIITKYIMKILFFFVELSFIYHKEFIENKSKNNQLDMQKLV